MNKEFHYYEIDFLDLLLPITEYVYQNCDSWVRTETAESELRLLSQNWVRTESQNWVSELSVWTECQNWVLELSVRTECQNWVSELSVRTERQNWESKLRVKTETQIFKWVSAKVCWVIQLKRSKVTQVWLSTEQVSWESNELGSQLKFWFVCSLHSTASAYSVKKLERLTTNTSLGPVHPIMCGKQTMVRTILNTGGAPKSEKCRLLSTHLLRLAVAFWRTFYSLKGRTTVCLKTVMLCGLEMRFKTM